jgi:hypothetical protein
MGNRKKCPPCLRIDSSSCPDQAEQRSWPPNESAIQREIKTIALVSPYSRSSFPYRPTPAQERSFPLHLTVTTITPSVIWLLVISSSDSCLPS